MKKTKLWNLIGLILGIALVITGIVFACAPADSYSTSSAPRDAEFGADFYTYQYDATRAAAINTAVTANNIRELGHAHAAYAGAFFIFAGLLVMVCFGKKFFCEEAVALPVKENPVPAAAEETETYSDSSME